MIRTIAKKRDEIELDFTVKGHIISGISVGKIENGFLIFNSVLSDGIRFVKDISELKQLIKIDQETQLEKIYKILKGDAEKQ